MSDGFNDADLLARLGQMSLTNLTSLMLRVYRNKARVTPQELLRRYSANRFTKPSAIDAELTRSRLRLLEIGRANRFSALELSPVAPLGACSAVGAISQDKVLSSIRGTEVLADATNSIALHICEQVKSNQRVCMEARETPRLLRYCTFQRARALTTGKTPGQVADDPF